MTNVNWAGVGSNMEWVKAVRISEHKWLLSWIIDASESTFFDVATLDLSLLAQEDELAVEDKWSKWHLNKVTALRIWWRNAADLSI